MVVNDDSIISCRERKEERNNESASERSVRIIKDSESDIENVECRSVRVTHNIITSIKTNKKYSIKRDISVYDKR